MKNPKCRIGYLANSDFISRIGDVNSNWTTTITTQPDHIRKQSEDPWRGGEIRSACDNLVDGAA